MSKRYGRNQKRRHRDRIAALEQSQEMDRALLSRVSSELSSLRSEVEQWDEEIRRLLGEHSALRRETHEVLSRNPLREVPIRMPVSKPYDVEAMDMVQPTMWARERMRRFVFTIQKDDLRMQRLIRFMEIDGYGGVAYSISETALAQGFGRREIAYMAHEIATNMAGHWNSHERSMAVR